MDFDWIENNILLHTLKEGERKLLTEVFDIVDFDIGDSLVTQGNDERAMFIIRDGMAAITYLHGETQTHIGFAESGSIVGDMSFFRKHPASATVSAVSPIRAYRLTRPSYCKLLVVNHELMMNLLTYIHHHAVQALDHSNHQLATILSGIKPK